MRAVGLLLLCAACQGAAAPQKLPAHPALDPGGVVAFPATTLALGFDGGVQGPDGSNWWVNELPPHPVSLSAFLLDRSEVTVAQYATFLGWAGGLGHYSPRMSIGVGPTSADFTAAPGASALPIGWVTWFDARAYCLWMGGDLPTEAQWELAAKGATSRVYPWAPTEGGPSCALASFFTGDVVCTEGPTDAGSHPEGDTPEGLHDMGGNVAEWLFDAYDWYPGAALALPVYDGGQPESATAFPGVAGTQQDPHGPVQLRRQVDRDPHGPDAGSLYGEGTTLRVIRGGGFHDLGLSVRTTARWGADGWLRSPGVGFRCAYPSP